MMLYSIDVCVFWYNCLHFLLVSWNFKLAFKKKRVDGWRSSFSVGHCGCWREVERDQCSATWQNRWTDSSLISQTVLLFHLPPMRHVCYKPLSDLLQHVLPSLWCHTVSLRPVWPLFRGLLQEVQTILKQLTKRIDWLLLWHHFENPVCKNFWRKAGI